MIQIYHNTRMEKYRFPAGAVAEGTEVKIGLDVTEDNADIFLCYAYGLYSFSYSEKQMTDSGKNYYEETIRVQGETGLFFYWFRIVKKENTNKFYFYVRDSAKNDGSGVISDAAPKIEAEGEKHPRAFQITVSKETFKTPDWFKGALIYQIFPDRFFRGETFSQDAMMQAKKAQERIYHIDWYEDVDIKGTEETGYIACDFFGGTLDGIREKIPYLRDLHIDCLYINPVFEARSNHRYDTADYLHIDPMLGGNEAFARMEKELKAAGIRVILDGVFSHTGADSVYFNKFSRYPGTGAYMAYRDHTKSPYSSWYSFSGEGDGISYDSWWGFPDLPNVKEDDLSYRQFIFGTGGVLETWLKRGAAGFRLDVSDELPDSFLRELQKTVNRLTGGEGVVMGEVWEDASNKVSYGNYRDFLFGNTHDCVMGYTFRDAVLGFLSGRHPAQTLNNLLETYRENYPAEAYYCMMNLISSHDVTRAITEIAGDKDPGNRETQQKMILDKRQREKGFALLRLALALQIGYIGSPSIYYGDEIGMQGYRDPFNRRTYPWGRLDEIQKAHLSFCREFTGLRTVYPVLKTGAYKTLYAQGDVFVFERTLDPENKDFFGKACVGARRVLVAVNRNEEITYSFGDLGISLPPLSCYAGEML